jgi:hypothetical protein
VIWQSGDERGERLDQSRVELPAGLAFQLGESVLDAARRPPGAVEALALAVDELVCQAKWETALAAGADRCAIYRLRRRVENAIASA